MSNSGTPKTIEKEQMDGVDRRSFLMAGAAGLAAAGLGMKDAAANPAAPGPELRTNSKTGIRTAVISDAQLNIGPFLARKMAALGYNLVIADVQKGLVDFTFVGRFFAAHFLKLLGIEQIRLKSVSLLRRCHPNRSQ
jgi:hypothetical protein